MSENVEYSKEEVYQKVITILNEVLNLESGDAKITPETRFIEDLGAESLDMAQFVMSLEDEFQKSIKDEELTELKSIQDAADFIYKKLSEPDE